MTAFTARPFRGEDIPALIDFARDLTIARLPGLTYWDPGDIVWQLGAFPAGTDFSKFARIWEDDAGIAALCAFEPPLNFGFDVHPRVGLKSALAQEVVAWAEARRREVLGAEGELVRARVSLERSSLSVEALETDGARIAFLEAHGYSRGTLHGVCHRRALAGALLEPAVPAGMRLRHATDADIDARAELHRDAWSVWGNSTFSPGKYRRLRAEPLYDETLDIVVEGDNGRLLSYCICWYDPVTGIGDFEPVGTRPEFASRGLGRAVVIEGLRRLQTKGAHTALIDTASVNPAARRTYTAAGFEYVARRDTYTRVMGT